jgi:hypothetical protein
MGAEAERGEAIVSVEAGRVGREGFWEARESEEEEEEGVVVVVVGGRGLLGTSVWLVFCSSVSITSEVSLSADISSSLARLPNRVSEAG